MSGESEANNTASAGSGLSLLPRYVILCLALGTVSSVLVLSLQAQPDFRIHASILIDGNNDFVSANGVVSGKGTPPDPYIIEGWEITGTIIIRNTDAHFVIRNVKIHASSSYYGVHLDQVANGSVRNSTIEGPSDAGILIEDSRTIAISSNTLSNNGEGIRSVRSLDIDISANTVSGYGAAVNINDSVAKVSNNAFTGGGIAVNNMDPAELSNLDISLDNLVNGSPLRYFKDCTNLLLDGVPVGQLIIANCNGVWVRNLLLSGTNIAIQLAFVNGANITSNNITGSHVGMQLLSSSLVAIATNEVSCNWTCIVVSGNNNRVARNTITQSVPTGYGSYGVYVTGSYNNITGNIISGRDYVASIGILLGNSNNTVIDNTLFDNGEAVHSVGGNLISSNLVSSNYDGLNLGLEDVAVGNEISANGGSGIIVTSSQNKVLRNNVSNNNQGVFASAYASGSLIFRNNFVSNWVQAVDQSGTVYWDSGYPDGGNFWSDHVVVDVCNGPFQNICTGPDGVVDVQYLIDSNSIDNYPLVVPEGPVDLTPPAWIDGSWLQIADMTSTSVTLYWSMPGRFQTLSQMGPRDNVGVVAYRVYQGDTPIATVDFKTVLIKVDELIPGTEYQFRVEAGDLANNWSTDGPSVAITIPSGPSEPPHQTIIQWWEQYWYFTISLPIAAASLALFFQKLRKQRDPERAGPE